MNPNLLITAADPFLIRVDNSTTSCIEEFKGPKFMVLNIEKGKQCKLSKSEAKELERADVKLITFPGENELCKDEEVAKERSLWSISECSLLNETTSEVQIKILGSNTYIFCYGETITINEKNFSYPPSVFRLTRKRSFSVGSYSHKVIKFNTSKSLLAFDGYEEINNMANLAISSGQSIVLTPIDLPEQLPPTNLLGFEYETVKKPWFIVGTTTVILLLVLTCTKIIVLMNCTPTYPPQNLPKYYSPFL